MLTEQEKQLIREQQLRDSLLEPFKRIMEDWSVETRHKFQDRISELELVASGDLESDWKVQVRAVEGGAIVAEFVFKEYGRLFDMRRVDYRFPPPADALEAWVRSKIDKGQIRYSTLAQRLNVSFSDPRVIHDLKFRFAKSDKFKLPRRRWYNKLKQASVHVLYDQLQEAMAEAVLIAARSDLKATPNIQPS